MSFFKFHSRADAFSELDITSFMNVMIVLVPALLMSMSFAQIRVLDINLPELTGGVAQSAKGQSNLEVRIETQGFKVFYPEDTLIQEIPLKHAESGDFYDYETLSLVMQGVKQQITERRDVLILSGPSVDYQNLVYTMDTVKSFKTVVAANLVEIELFPEISLGDAATK